MVDRHAAVRQYLSEALPSCLLLTSTQRFSIIQTMSDFGKRLRELRHEKGFTLRQLADMASVDFTYLSKIENNRVPYTPAADTIRTLARALGVDPLQLLQLADKLPQELKTFNAHAQARRFFERAQSIASPEDWDALLEVLEKRRASRGGSSKE